FEYFFVNRSSTCWVRLARSLPPHHAICSLPPDASGPVCRVAGAELPPPQASSNASRVGDATNPSPAAVNSRRVSMIRPPPVRALGRDSVSAYRQNRSIVPASGGRQSGSFAYPLGNRFPNGQDAYHQ